MRASEKLKGDKERLIRDWLRAQDEAEALNARIYRLSCEIETVNLKIERALEKERLEEQQKKRGASRKRQTKPAYPSTSSE